LTPLVYAIFIFIILRFAAIIIAMLMPDAAPHKRFCARRVMPHGAGADAMLLSRFSLMLIRHYCPLSSPLITLFAFVIIFAFD
jgi:hypothetical protein